MELIEGTSQIWVERLGHFEFERLRSAFDTIEERAMRWPSLAAIIEALPRYVHPNPKDQIRPERAIEVDPDAVEQSRQRIRQMVEDCASRLGIQKSGLTK